MQKRREEQAYGRQLAGNCRDTYKNCELFNLSMIVAQMVKMAVCGYIGVIFKR